MARAKLLPGLAGARALDAADELAPLRREFELPREQGRTLTYLCGHSLGLMPRATRRALEVELDRWSTLGVDGHFPDARPPRQRDAARAAMASVKSSTPILSVVKGAP